MSEAKMMAELAAQVAEKGYDWKQRALEAEKRAVALYVRCNEIDADLDRAKEQIRRLQETVDRKQAAKLLLQKEVAEQRGKDAQLVRDMLADPKWNDQPWARMALTVAARAIERGRHWTPSERLDNLFEGLMQDADEEIPADVQERITERVWDAYQKAKGEHDADRKD